jgi:hypothetical protein
LTATVGDRLMNPRLVTIALVCAVLAVPFCAWLFVYYLSNLGPDWFFRAVTPDSDAAERLFNVGVACSLVLALLAAVLGGAAFFTRFSRNRPARKAGTAFILGMAELLLPVAVILVLLIFFPIVPPG